MSARAWLWRRWKLPPHDLTVTANGDDTFDIDYAPISRLEATRRRRVYGIRGRHNIGPSLKTEEAQ